MPDTTRLLDPDDIRCLYSPQAMRAFHLEIMFYANALDKRRNKLSSFFMV